jgi:hypothetical protein
MQKSSVEVENEKYSGANMLEKGNEELFLQTTHLLSVPLTRPREAFNG